jgi:hypothetical protein
MSYCLPGWGVVHSISGIRVAHIILTKAFAELANKSIVAVKVTSIVVFRVGGCNLLLVEEISEPSHYSIVLLCSVWFCFLSIAFLEFPVRVWRCEGCSGSNERKAHGRTEKRAHGEVLLLTNDKQKLQSPSLKRMIVVCVLRWILQIEEVEASIDTLYTPSQHSQSV